MTLPAPTTPCDLREPAERQLRAARQAGQPSGVAAALTDLGVVLLRRITDAARALDLLNEALTIVRLLGNRSAEVDVLGNLGLAHMLVGQAVVARQMFEQELALARALADRFAEKLALEHLAQAAVALGDPAAARSWAEQSLALVRQLADRRHEADLLWFIAIQHAEIGQRNQALATAQDAVASMRAQGKPQAAWFADHLHRYREDSETGLVASLAPPALGQPEPLLVGAWAPHAVGPPATAKSEHGPGILKMALSATEALAKFVGSGFQTTAAPIHEARLHTCAGCPHHTGLRCRLCGCFIGAKARLPYERCPISKWPA